jgi:hypothetical protein
VIRWWLNRKDRSAAEPQPKRLPLLREVEERAGERRSVSCMSAKAPRSSILSPLLRRGERKKILAAHENSDG